MSAPSSDAALAPKAEETLARRQPAAKPARPRRSLGLVGRLLLLTIGIELIISGSFSAMRLAAFRHLWLHDRIIEARSTLVAFGVFSGQDLPAGLTRKILQDVGAKEIVVDLPHQRIVLADSVSEPNVSEIDDATDLSTMENLRATFRTLFADPNSLIRIVGPAPAENAVIEVTQERWLLIQAMRRVARNYVALLLLASTLVALALWVTLWLMVIRPVQRLTSSIIAFGERPQEPLRIVEPSGRDDEIGRAETALAAMQASLAHELSQRKRLAELGMAVARINHDLRNMLAAAQLISDRLATISDPLAQRLAPRLVATLDRAIQFCQSTLVYGAARERAPSRRQFDLREVVRQIVETAEATGAGAILYAIDIPPHFELLADPDHVQRIMENLCRNAAQVLHNQGASGDRPLAIRFAAIRITGGMALIEVSDTGPGFTPEQTPHIFEPFHLSTREGGTGLGLAIAADLVARNGGSIALTPAQDDDFYCGARFLITLPTPQEAGKPAHAPALSA